MEIILTYSASAMIADTQGRDEVTKARSPVVVVSMILAH